jgi:hypothetical protein
MAKHLWVIISCESKVVIDITDLDKTKNNNVADALDQLQNAMIEEATKKQKESSKKEYHFNKLKMYFGEDYEVIPGVTISMPTLADIIEIGEEDFYRSLSPFLYNSTSIRLLLWENQIDWCKVKDIEVFAMLISTVEKEALNILFKNISFDDFKLLQFKENQEAETPQLVLYSESQNILWSEDNFMTIAEYIREIMNVHPKVEKAKGKTAKSWMIQEEKMHLIHKKDKETSTLLPLISTCVNHPGFKYKTSELKEIGIYQFMDSVQRLQIYESSRALLSGSYSGFCDTSKIPKENFNFFREVS